MPLTTYQAHVDRALTPVVPAQADPAAGVGLETAGKALSQTAQQSVAILLDARARATIADATKASAGFGSEAGDIFARYKGLRGDQALQGSEAAQIALENARKRWAEGLSSEEAKAIFERQSQELAGKYKLSMTEHFVQQTRVAQEANAGAAAASAVNQAALHYRDPDMLETLWRQAGAQTAALAATPEEGKARMQAVQQDVLGSAIAGALQAQDPDAAKALFYANREALGAKGPELEKAINTSSLIAQADTKAGEIEAKLHTGPDGWLDTADLQKHLDAIPDPRLKEATEAQLRQRITLAEAAQAQAVRAVGKTVQGAYNVGGIATAQAAKLPDGRSAWEWLNTHNPDKVAAIKNDSYTKWRQSKQDKDTTRREVMDARQKAKQDFLSLDPEQQASVDVDERYGLATDPVGVSTLKALQQKAKQRVDKGLAVSESEFVRDGMAQILGVVSQGKTPREASEAAKVVRGDLSATYGEFVAEKQRPPNDEEKAALIDGKLSRVVKERPILWNTSEWGYERSTRMREERRARTGTAPVPAPVPAARRPVKYRVSPDGKQRAPVYADGTVGPVEAAP